jgi:hypothetical protein
MRLSTAGRALVIIGALVGAAAGIGLATGFDITRIPAWMVTVGMYKLVFIAAGGLLFAGAVLGRAARQTRPNDGDRTPRALGRAPATFPDGAAREAEPVERERRPDAGP